MSIHCKACIFFTEASEMLYINFRFEALPFIKRKHFILFHLWQFGNQAEPCVRAQL